MVKPAPLLYDPRPRLAEMPKSDRPRERLRALGAPNLTTLELLAILVSSGTPKAHVLHVAENLVKNFQGLQGIYKANLTELQRIQGIGEVRAIQLKAALELGQRLTQQLHPEDRPSVTSPDDIWRLVGPEMALLEQEELRLVMLNTRNEVLRLQLLYRGSVNTAQVRVAEIMRAAIRENATAIVLVHNHPSGDNSPSEQDLGMTRQVYDAGRLLDIQVLDHIIIAQRGPFSMKERGLGFP